MTYEPSLTVEVDHSPCPRVQVTFASLDPDVATITVYRNANGRQLRVQGAVNAYAIGGFSTIDYAVPNGASSYLAEQFDSDGDSLGFTDSSSITAAYPGAWMQDPLDPTTAVQVQFEKSALAVLNRPIGGTVYYPEGRGTGVAIVGQRQGLTNLSLDVVTIDDASASKIDALFGSSLDGYGSPAIVCVRASLAGLPSPLYAFIASPVRNALDGGSGGSTVIWNLQGQEVSPPLQGLAVTTLSRDDLDASYATRSAMAAAYATRLARDSDFTLTGAAG